MSTKHLPTTRGPFKAEYLRSGDPYELSNGHAIQCLPTGGRGSRANLLGGTVLDSDPAVDEAGVDTGFSPQPGTLRAPDVAVGKVPNVPGWVQGVPSLALEYADSGQDETALAEKIADLLEAGTGMVWVVRLSGPRCVEVYRPRQAVQLYLPGQLLEAPGILKNPVPVEALYDRDAAHEITLRNLLQRRGYSSLEAVHAAGEAQGRVEGEAKGRVEGEAKGRLDGRMAILLEQLTSKFGPLPPETVARIENASLEDLRRWGVQLLVATTLEEALGAG
jgi:Uma2 family endonuclease